jgi:triacylglycerol lipase
MVRVLIVLLGLVSAGICAFLVHRLWKARTAARARKVVRPPRLDCPVVLAHGVLGFVERRAGPFRGEYFRNVPDRLRLLGSEVHALSVPLSSSVSVRAQALKDGIDRLGCKKVNIVAHSMGGIDARYAIARLGLSDKVASLTTIGSPHLGTPLADLGTNLLGEKLMLRKLMETLGWDVQAFYDLTTAHMESFNQSVANVPGVAYASYAGRVARKRQLNPLLLPTHVFLNERAGENDGIVPVSSQRWGDVLGVIDADHWAQIGWSRHFDALAFYEGLWRELRGRGL